MTESNTARGSTLRSIVAGPDEHELGEALAALDVTVSRIDDVISASTLAAAGIDEADYLVVTDVAEATGIAVAKDRNPDIFVVTFADRSLPEFVAAVADLAIDPALLDVDVVAAELLNTDDA